MMKRLIIWLLVAAVVYFFVSTIMKSQRDRATGLTDGISQTTESIKDKGKALLGGDKDDEYDFDKEYDDSRDASSSSKNSKDEEETIVDEDAAYDDDEDAAYDDDVDEGKAGSSSSKSNNKEVAYDDFKKGSDEEDKSDYDKSREIAAKRSYSSGTSGSSSSKASSSSSSNSSTSYSSNEGRYLVVTGSYRDEVNAKEMVRKLKEMGYDGAEQFSFDFSEYYSVTAGRYASSSKAREIATALEDRGISAYAHKMRSKFFED